MELTKNQKIMIGVAVVAVAFFMYQRSRKVHTPMKDEVVMMTPVSE